MSDARDERSEVLDDDRLPEEYPPERPLAVDDYGVTGAEQATPEPLEEYVAREVPHVTTVDVARERAPRPAEEAAMGLTGEPPLGPDDGYLEG